MQSGQSGLWLVLTESTNKDGRPVTDGPLRLELHSATEAAMKLASTALEAKERFLGTDVEGTHSEPAMSEEGGEWKPCALCGDTNSNLTLEHIFGDWMAKEFPRANTA